MVTVKEHRLVLGVGKHGGGLIEQVGNSILGRAVVGAAVINNRNMNPFHSQLGAQLAFLNRQIVVAGMSQGDDGLDLVIANDLTQWPWLLPGTAKDLAGLNGHELARENVIVSVPPELFRTDPRYHDQERSTNPG